MPQIKPKARHIQLGVKTFPTLLKWAKKNGYTPSDWLESAHLKALCDQERYLKAQQFDEVVRELFHMPRFDQSLPGRRFFFDGVMSTNGIQVSWLFGEKTNTPIDRKRKKKKVEPQSVPTKLASHLTPGLYDHGKDFWLQPDDDRHYVIIDPGHVNVMSGHYELRGPTSPDFNCKTAARFLLTNRQYRSETGMRRRAMNAQRARNHDPPQRSAHQDLTNNSSKTWDPGKYIQHVACALRHWRVLFDRAFQPQLRKDRFKNYQGKQRVTHKIAATLKGTDPKTVLVVGSGVSSATSRGHDSAPGKQLRRRLAHLMPVIMTPEHFTSKLSPCCHAEVYHGRYDQRNKDKKGRPIRGLSHCSCGLTFNRDYAAALNISAIFWHQAEFQTTANTLPPQCAPARATYAAH